MKGILPANMGETKEPTITTTGFGAWQKELKRGKVLSPDEEQLLGKKISKWYRIAITLFRECIIESFNIPLKKVGLHDTLHTYILYTVSQIRKYLGEEGVKQFYEKFNIPLQSNGKPSLDDMRWKINDYILGLANEVERRIIEEGMVAREQVINANLRLVASISCKYGNKGLWGIHDDLFQGGLIGLIQAVDRFDWNRGTKLSTIAVPWITQCITRTIQKQPMITIPHRLLEKYTKIVKELREQGIENLWSADIDDNILSSCSIKEAKELIEVIKTAQPISLESTTVYSSSKSEGDVVLLDTISTEDIEGKIDPEEECMKRQAREIINNALETLPERMRIALSLRLGLEDNETLSFSEIGRRLKVSRQRAKQLYDEAIRWLKRNPRLREMCN